MWPFRGMSERRRLRRECLSEIVEAATEQGIEFTHLFIDDKTGNPEVNKARLALENLKQKGLDYSIEFYVLQDFSPIVSPLYRNKPPRNKKNLLVVKTLKNPLGVKPFTKHYFERNYWYYRRDANEQIPEGFIKPPIGTIISAGNIEHREYWRKKEEIKAEIYKQEKQRTLEKFNRDYQKWSSVPMEEWEKRAKESGYECGCDNGIVYKNDPDTQDIVAQGQCPSCFGTGRLTSERLKFLDMPNKWNEFYHPDIYAVDRLVDKKMKELGVNYPSKPNQPFLVYARITKI